MATPSPTPPASTPSPSPTSTTASTTQPPVPQNVDPYATCSFILNVIMALGAGIAALVALAEYLRVNSERRKEQAACVASWVTMEDEPDALKGQEYALVAIAVRNASQLPVFRATVKVTRSQRDKATGKTHQATAWFYTDVLRPGDTVVETEHLLPWPIVESAEPASGTWATVVAFWDASGVAWCRGEDGQLKRRNAAYIDSMREGWSEYKRKAERRRAELERAADPEQGGW